MIDMVHMASMVLVVPMIPMTVPPERAGGGVHKPPGYVHFCFHMVVQVGVPSLQVTKPMVPIFPMVRMVPMAVPSGFPSLHITRPMVHMNHMVPIIPMAGKVELPII